jgi:hypothetical protein
MVEKEKARGIERKKQKGLSRKKDSQGWRRRSKRSPRIANYQTAKGA